MIKLAGIDIGNDSIKLVIDGGQVLPESLTALQEMG